MNNGNKEKKKSIFFTIFVPLIIVMVLQSGIFYLVAVYGGVEQSLNQNAVSILSEQVKNRKNEIETRFNKDWATLTTAYSALNSAYSNIKSETSTDYPLVGNKERQTRFIKDASGVLISTLRSNKVNGVFLILNNTNKDAGYDSGDAKRYGLCIRDLDQNSNSTNDKDLLQVRSPSALVDSLGCSLDSWWEANYNFKSEEEGSYYYEPLKAAWDNPNADSDDLAYFCPTHKLNDADQPVVSYSIPLMDEDGYPYGVLGIELTTKYLSSLLPSNEIGEDNDGCYILAMNDSKTHKATPIVANGSLYNRSFSPNKMIDCSNVAYDTGFSLTGRSNNELYGDMEKFDIYNNNNPFEDSEFSLMAVVEKSDLFAYSSRVKTTLLWISLLCLAIGIVAIFFISSRFSAPIKALANKARTMKLDDDLDLGHLGITEIDQMVDAIEDLNKNVSKEVARTEFFSRMSHDMRTPMNAIISFSSPDLLDGTDEAEKSEYLSKIHGSGQYLLGLINEVLDMTKIESNKVDLILEPKKASNIWNVDISMVSELAISKNVKFSYKVNCEENLVVNLDAQHINQITMNLLSNAVKFTKALGNVWLNVDIEDDVENPEEKCICKIVVKDTGIGMSESFMDKLYLPFEQEANDAGGTGLGLSISKKLVELMDGSIECISEKNVGTTFTVVLPLDKASASKLMLSDNTEEETPDDLETDSNKEKGVEVVLAGKNVLLCEDHPMNAEIARKLLHKKGMKVYWAVNGEIGLEMFKDSKEGFYDAILMDIRMPELNGLDAARAIKELNREDAKEIPIIAMTANAFAEDEKASRDVGMVEHLSKPINPKLLYEVLETYIK